MDGLLLILFFGCMTCLKLKKFITSRRYLYNIIVLYKKNQKFLRNLCHDKNVSLESLIKDAHMTPAFCIPKERQYEASIYKFEKCRGPFKASWLHRGYVCLYLVLVCRSTSRSTHHSNEDVCREEVYGR